MLRAVLTLCLASALTSPVRADEPPAGPPPTFDEPTPKSPETPPAQTQAPAPPAPPQVETPPPAPPAPPPPAPPPAASNAPKVGSDGMIEEVIPNPSKKWGLAFAGAAAGAFVIGGILGGVALSRSDEQSGNPSNPPIYTKDLQDRGREGETLAKTSYAFFAIGGILAIVDAVMWYEALRAPRVVRRPAVATTITPQGVRF
jgi:hypothetical protein